MWYLLFLLSIGYNFHRYLLYYSNGALGKEGYQQTPFVWQVGKYILVAGVLSVIYINSRFTRRIPAKLLAVYALIGLILLINVGSVLLFGKVSTEELEYVVFALLVLPIGFIAKDELYPVADQIDRMLNITQYLLIASNLYVILGYLLFRRIPFHAYEGILMRFGGLWDDPNTFAIISVLMLGYALFKKQYVLAGFHIVNVLLTVSLNGYLLLITLVSYWFLNTPTNRLLRVVLFIGLLVLFALGVAYNLEYAVQIYEAKRESIEQHSSFYMDFYPIPLLQPIVFHETWFLSMNVNYFPFSVPFTVAALVVFVRFFLFKPKSLQRLMFILFFVTSLFLPFLYMFPVNFLAFLLLALYTKGIQF
ncbi:hypothetical protein DYU11_15295 [Fibrisoma montanum]|uniref:Uncharacterized protein n=2 Tax=Fibrisoma montanum TaxID=2305895 RepID=A0A418M8G0_9BACT|nr:hypothetical protein DYU11_15295 [Fibrisoma montanum]